jgi:hypothetical protein
MWLAQGGPDENRGYWPTYWTFQSDIMMHDEYLAYLPKTKTCLCNMQCNSFGKRQDERQGTALHSIPPA